MGILGEIFLRFFGKSFDFGLKVHSGHCGTVEKRQKSGHFSRLLGSFLVLFGWVLGYFLQLFGSFLGSKFKTKQFVNTPKAYSVFGI